MLSTGTQRIAIMPGTRFQQRVMINSKWYVLTDLSLGEFELEETEDGDIVETEVRRSDRHIVSFDIDLFCPQAKDNVA